MTSLHYTCLLFYWSLQRTSRQYLCLQMTLEHAWSLGTGASSLPNNLRWERQSHEFWEMSCYSWKDVYG
jgi:hypothetical protein